MLRQARLATLAGRVRPVCRRWLSDNAIATSVTSDKSKLSTQVNEPTLDPDTVQAFTGTPAEMLETRVVKIYQPSQGVQNANQNTLVWKMQWEDAQTERWSNPLMGWTSTNDPLSNTHMTLEFDSAESAARFCMHNGWKYEIVKDHSLKPNLAMAGKGPKKYAENFYWKGPKGREFPKLYEPPPPPPKN